MVFVESNQYWLSADGWWGVHSVPGNYIHYAVTSCDSDFITKEFVAESDQPMLLFI